MAASMLTNMRSRLGVVLLITLIGGPFAFATDETNEARKDTHSDDALMLPDDVIPMLLEDELPKRTGPLIELGPPLLGTGKLSDGFVLPTGAVWTPSLWVVGAYRTSINYVDQEGQEALIEWPHRLDLYTNLQLSGTERLLFEIRPLHHDGKFTGYTFKPDSQSGWNWETEIEIGTLFFEGNVGEIFPKLARRTRRGLDVGFSIGRQQIEFQDGIMFNDRIDSIGVTRNSIPLRGTSNLRVTAVFGWDNIHRDDNVEDEDALVYGVFSEIDTPLSTIEIDLAYVQSSLDVGSAGDGSYWGIGATQRFGFLNTTFRVNGSRAIDKESDAVSDGTLIFAELSRDLRASHDQVYLDLFWGIDRYSSAARAPTAGGPLGRTGLLFAAVGLGRFKPALGNRADDSVGAAIGLQKFFDTDRTQIVVEVGTRHSTVDTPDAAAVGVRLQRKLGRRYLLQVDGYLTENQDGPSVRGLRTEVLVAF